MYSVYMLVIVLVNLTLLNLYNCVSVWLDFVSQSCRMYFVVLSNCECASAMRALWPLQLTSMD